MAVIEIAKIQVRRGQENTTGIPQLAPGEFGWAEDTQHLYIGKRISEGANNDNNSRILTEIDLGGIQSLLSGASTTTVNTLYNYRSNISYINTVTQNDARLLQTKLDDFVNLKDFVDSRVTLSSGTDVTQYLKTAIQTLYTNPYTTNKSEPRRKLLIPAGTYLVTATIFMPPYLQLVGEGQDITTLIYSGTNTNMFRTVDALGVGYTGSMQQGSGASKGVRISDMTLAYSNTGSTVTAALVSLDNTEDAKIQNVTFTTAGAVLTSTTFVNYGRGIDIRGNIGSDESTAISRNNTVVNCQFNLMYSGIGSTGTVSRPVFENNVFMNLHQGMSFTSQTIASPIPNNVLITKNKFEYILTDAINVAQNKNPSNVISSQNVFYYVGNGSSMMDQSATSSTTATSVITFNAPGNISSNDYFNRRLASTTTDAAFYYNPLVSGKARINSDAVYSSLITNGTLNQEIIKIPLTGSDQMGIIDYQLGNSFMSRKGRLTLNVSPDGYASVSDYYNSSEVTSGSAKDLVFSTLLDQSDSTNPATYRNYVKVTLSSFAGTPTNVEYSLDLIV